MTNSTALVASCVTALGKMREARLADYGTFPKSDEAQLEMARVYADALSFDPDRPADPEIDVECVVAATDRAIRETRGGESRMPSAPHFRELCCEEWHNLYRLIGHDMLTESGGQVTIAVKVRRDASDAQVAQVKALASRRAESRGLRPMPAPLPASAESLARMRRTMGIPEPALRSGDQTIVKGMP